MFADSPTSSKDGPQKALSDKELVEIKHKLETGYCNPVWRDYVVSLIDEVERLRSLLDLLGEQQKQKRKTEKE